MTAVQRRAPARMTVAEFMEWDGGGHAGRRWQLVDGRPVAMAPASQTHGSIVTEPGALLRNHLLERGGPCRVVTEPGVTPRALSADDRRIPDLGVTCSPSLSDHMLPDPVLLVEVLSPSNHAETRADVRAYTTIPSVVEILVVHGDRMEAELPRRGADLSWPSAPEIVSAPDTLALESVGLSLPLAAPYRTTAIRAA